MVDARVGLAQVHVLAEHACVGRRARAGEGGAVRDALANRVARVGRARVADLAVNALEAGRAVALVAAGRARRALAVLAGARLARVVVLAALARVAGRTVAVEAAALRRALAVLARVRVAWV